MNQLFREVNEAELFNIEGGRTTAGNGSRPATRGRNNTHPREVGPSGRTVRNTARVAGGALGVAAAAKSSVKLAAAAAVVNTATSLE